MDVALASTAIQIVRHTIATLTFFVALLAAVRVKCAQATRSAQLLAPPLLAVLQDTVLIL